MTNPIIDIGHLRINILNVLAVSEVINEGEGLHCYEIHFVGGTIIKSYEIVPERLKDWRKPFSRKQFIELWESYYTTEK